LTGYVAYVPPQGWNEYNKLERKTIYEYARGVGILEYERVEMQHEHWAFHLKQGKWADRLAERLRFLKDAEEIALEAVGEEGEIPEVLTKQNDRAGLCSSRT
jgi:hypothetical protein